MERWSIVLAGVAQLGMVGVGFQVPRVFGWKEDLPRLRPSNRRLFWVYGIFIVLANIGFGVLTLVHSAEIAAGKGMAGGFALFAGLYWLARLVAQYAAFNTPDWPDVPLAKHGLGAVVLAISLAYLLAFFRGLP